MIAQAILFTMLLTKNPLCRVYPWDYSKRGIFSYFQSPEEEKIVRTFFNATKKAIERNDDLRNIFNSIDKIKPVDNPKSPKEQADDFIKGLACHIMIKQSLEVDNLSKFRYIVRFCKKTRSAIPFDVIIKYDRASAYINYALYCYSFSLAQTNRDSIMDYLMPALDCNKIDLLRKILRLIPYGSNIGVIDITRPDIVSITQPVMPLNDICLIKKFITDSESAFRRINGLNLETKHGKELHKKGVTSPPMFIALSGIAYARSISYKGATLEILKHLIKNGAKITPQTLDGKSPYALVEKSCRTSKEKKEAIKYLRSIGIKDFGSKDVKQVNCKTDISEKGVYIYIGDKPSKPKKK